MTRHRNSQQTQVLAALESLGGPATAAELSSLTGICERRLFNVVSRLIDAGLVRVLPAEGDERVRYDIRDKPLPVFQLLRLPWARQENTEEGKDATATGATAAAADHHPNTRGTGNG